jgi:hypothetical protein
MYLKKYCITLRKVICEAKKLYYNQLIETSNRNKTAWNIIRNVFHKPTKYNHMPATLKMDNKNIQFKDVADAFNEHFLNIADSLQTHTDKRNSPLKLLKNAYHRFSEYESNSCNQRRNYQYNLFFKIKKVLRL